MYSVYGLKARQLTSYACAFRMQFAGSVGVSRVSQLPGGVSARGAGRSGAADAPSPHTS